MASSLGSSNLYKKPDFLFKTVSFEPPILLAIIGLPIDWASTATLPKASGSIEADIIKQKLPNTNNGFNAIKFGKTHKDVYNKLTSEHPIDLTRYQIANNYMGRFGLINSGGASGSNDLQDAVETAVINKRAGGMGLISGRKAFQKPLKEGIQLLNTIQDVYLCPEIDIA